MSIRISGIPLSLTIFMLSTVMFLSFGAKAAQEGDTSIVTVSGTLIEGGDCTINNGAPVRVNFGDDVYITEVNGTSYKKTEIPLNISCASAPSGLAMKLTFSASGIGAGCNTLLCTDREGLSLRLFKGDNELGMDEGVNFTVSDGEAIGLPSFWAVPALSGTPTAGAFNSFATVIIGMQ